VRDKRAELGLELVLDERVGSGDERGAFHKPQRPRELEPGELAWLHMEFGEAIQATSPHVREIYVSHR